MHRLAADVARDVRPRRAGVHRHEDRAAVRPESAGSGVRLELLVVHQPADDDHVGTIGGRDGEHVVHALRPDERRVAVVVDGEARRALRRVREARPGGVSGGDQRRGRLPGVVDAVHLRTLAAAARVGEVDPRLPVRQPHGREREAAAVEREDRLPAARRAACGRADQAQRRLRRVHDVRVARVELHLVDRAGLRERERRAAVRRGVDADCGRSGRPAARGVGADSAHARARADQDVARVARLDRDPRDRAVVRGRERTRHERPAGAVVGGLVEAEPGFAVAARVRLSGADVDRPARRIVRVDGDRADRVRRDPVRDLLPRRLLRERVLRPPHTAARRADVDRAVLRPALRVDRQRRHASRPLRRLDEGLGAEPIHVERVRADGAPPREQPRPARDDPLVRRDRTADLLDRDLRVRVCAVRVRLRVRAAPFALAAFVLTERGMRQP